MSETIPLLSFFQRRGENRVCGVPPTAGDVCRMLRRPRRSWQSQELSFLQVQLSAWSSVAGPDPSFFHPGSEFVPSLIPDPNFFYSGSWICIKEFQYFSPKIWSWLFIPDPDFYSSRIPDQEVKKAPDLGSVTVVWSTHWKLEVFKKTAVNALLLLQGLSFSDSLLFLLSLSSPMLLRKLEFSCHEEN